MKIRDVIGDLLLEGRIVLAQELQKKFIPEADLTALYIKYGFNSADRYDMSRIVAESVRPTTKLSAPYIKKFIGMSEASGTIENMQKGLILLDNYFDRLLLARADIDPRIVADAADVALFTHQYDRVAALFEAYPDLEACVAAVETVAKIKHLCDSVGVDWALLPQATECLKTGKRLAVDKPTAVLRISPRIWTHLTVYDMKAPRITDGFAFVETARANGLSAEIASQFSNAGPAFMAPYASKQDFTLLFVDHHKYSQPGPFIHFKSTVWRNHLVDYGGYSGWAEIGSRPDLHRIEDCDAAEAKAFAAEKRHELFSPFEDAQHPVDHQPYGFVVLQVAADSVLALAWIDMLQMTRLCISYFASLGLKTVVKRHPRCSNVGVTAFLKSIENSDDVIISTEPSQVLVKHASAVALVNSTVGFEAVLAHKPLLTFGQSEFALIARNVHSISDLETIADLDALVDDEMYDKFYYYYRNKYVVFGHDGLERRISEKMRNIINRSAGNAAGYETRDARILTG